MRMFDQYCYTELHDLNIYMDAYIWYSLSICPSLTICTVQRSARPRCESTMCIMTNGRAQLLGINYED